MKKFLLRIGIGIVALLILAALGVSLFLDGAIKRGVETLGPKLLKVNVKVDNVSLSLLTGSGAIQGLVVGNPEGFKTPQAIRVGSASLALKPGSLFSDKVVVRYIHVQAPEITFEADLGGDNLHAILANVRSTTGGGKPNAAAKPEAEKPGKKLEVDDFVITDAKVIFSLKGTGQAMTVTIPEIRLADLGTGPEGITAGQLTEQVLTEIARDSSKAAAGGFGDLNKTVNSITKDLGGTVGGSASNLTKGIGDLFKKK